MDMIAGVQDAVNELIDLVMEHESDEYDSAPIHTGVIFIHEGRVWFEIGGPGLFNSFITEAGPSDDRTYPYVTALDIQDIKSR